MRSRRRRSDGRARGTRKSTALEPSPRVELPSARTDWRSGRKANAESRTWTLISASDKLPRRETSVDRSGARLRGRELHLPPRDRSRRWRERALRQRGADLRERQRGLVDREPSFRDGRLAEGEGLG